MTTPQPPRSIDWAALERSRGEVEAHLLASLYEALRAASHAIDLSYDVPSGPLLKLRNDSLLLRAIERASAERIELSSLLEIAAGISRAPSPERRIKRLRQQLALALREAEAVAPDAALRDLYTAAFILRTRMQRLLLALLLATHVIASLVAVAPDVTPEQRAAARAVGQRSDDVHDAIRRNRELGDLLPGWIDGPTRQ